MAERLVFLLLGAQGDAAQAVRAVSAGFDCLCFAGSLGCLHFDRGFDCLRFGRGPG